jgi:hypothetical protein
MANDWPMYNTPGRNIAKPCGGAAVQTGSGVTIMRYCCARRKNFYHPKKMRIN